MADRGWSPKACIVGSSEIGREVIFKLQPKWKELIQFYLSYKKHNAHEFYDNKSTPVLDFFQIDPQRLPQNNIDTTKYQFVFLFTDDSLTIDYFRKIAKQNLSSITMVMSMDKIQDKQSIRSNETVVVFPNQGFYDRVFDFIIDIIRFCMFPRLVSFDFSDFNIMKKRVVKAIYFRSSTDFYLKKFGEIYNKIERMYGYANDAIVIFFFTNYKISRNYINYINGLRIGLFSDHCTSPSPEHIRALIIR